jgi:hypothetical protein
MVNWLGVVAKAFANARADGEVAPIADIHRAINKIAKYR